MVTVTSVTRKKPRSKSEVCESMRDEGRGQQALLPHVTQRTRVQTGSGFEEFEGGHTFPPALLESFALNTYVLELVYRGP